MANTVLTQTGAEVQADLNKVEEFLFDVPTGETLATNERIPAKVRANQMTTCIVQDATHNINGKSLTSFTSTDVTIGTYPAIKIQTSGGNNLTAEQAATYMSAQTGSSYVPEYDYDNPACPFLIFANGNVYKPQFDSTNGLLLYYVNRLAFNPMTSGGDLIYGYDASGTPGRLAKGSDGTVLGVTMNGNLQYFTNTFHSISITSATLSVNNIKYFEHGCIIESSTVADIPAGSIFFPYYKTGASYSPTYYGICLKGGATRMLTSYSINTSRVLSINPSLSSGNKFSIDGASSIKTDEITTSELTTTYINLNDSDVGLVLPDTSSWTANRTIATKNQVDAITLYRHYISFNATYGGESHLYIAYYWSSRSTARGTILIPKLLELSNHYGLIFYDSTLFSSSSGSDNRKIQILGQPGVQNAVDVFLYDSTPNSTVGTLTISGNITDDLATEPS